MKTKINSLHAMTLVLLVTTASANGTTRYVNVAGTNATPPYTNWATAATNIQAAVDVAVAYDTVLVTNGIYATGGRTLGTNVLVNRVTVDKPLTVRSVNGPQVTVVQGSQVPGTTNGDGAVRCVYLTNGASLSGFTLTNGATRISVPAHTYEQVGGGLWCWGAVVSNCTLIGNSAYNSGGGAYEGTLCNCTLIGNSAIYGGGAFYSTLNDCVLSGNSAYEGGGTYQSTLANGTLTGNSASYDGGGAYSGTLNNCIVYYNTGGNFSGSTLNYCCTTPLPTNGFGNITNEPAFADWANGNFHLQSNSPCINAGNNDYVTVAEDLDGNPRIAGSTVDVGAYEFQSPVSLISYAWLQQYGLPINTNTDASDPDGDGMNNWQEWMADTSPIDASDYLRITSFTRSGTYNTLWWTSKPTRLYQVERCAALEPSSLWETIITNATPGWNNAGFDNTGPQYFYRIRAVQP